MSYGSAAEATVAGLPAARRAPLTCLGLLHLVPNLARPVPDAPHGVCFLVSAPPLHWSQLPAWTLASLFMSQPYGR